MLSGFALVACSPVIMWHDSSPDMLLVVYGVVKAETTSCEINLVFDEAQAKKQIENGVKDVLQHLPYGE